MIYSAMDDGKISVLVLLDLSAAFDTIDHKILQQRLHNVFGFGDTVLSWFHSYLENRAIAVTKINKIREIGGKCREDNCYSGNIHRLKLNVFVKTL